MRNVLAVIVGVAVAGFVVMGVESLSHSVYPPPAGLALDDPKVAAAYVAKLPFLAIAFILVAWAAGALVGGAVAARLAVGRRTRRFGTIVGIVLLMMGALQLWMIPHPTWFVLAAPFACLIPGRLGGQLGARSEF